jgi:queuine tRNA-ribosyltransferase
MAMPCFFCDHATYGGLMPFSFQVQHSDPNSSARTGLLTTWHGTIQTPAFMPVGTLGTVKGLLPSMVSDMGYGLILGNTYHLALRPGPEIIAAHGGLHRFMDWDGAILTDSGGFQVYSLASLRKIKPEGAIFRSHIDGSLHEFTPQKVVAIQEALGSDIAMVLDVCPPSTAARAEIDQALELTTSWAHMAIEARKRPDQAMFGIIQGGLDENLRRQHAAAITALDFEGFAIGGLSVGEAPKDMYRVTAATTQAMPNDKPRYLMGVGMPADFARCVLHGIDMFDCVFPTRAGRTGLLLTSQGRIIIKNAAYRDDMGPLDPKCDCIACTRYTRACLRHLFVSKEILGSVLNTLHNLHFYKRLMERIRLAVVDGSLPQLADEMDALFATDLEGEAGNGVEER